MIGNSKYIDQLAGRGRRHQRLSIESVVIDVHVRTMSQQRGTYIRKHVASDAAETSRSLVIVRTLVASTSQIGIDQDITV